jgi:hypothetical protein
MKPEPKPDFSFLADGGRKKCKTCCKIKSVSEYVSDKSKIDGLLGDCKPCKRAKIKAWRDRTPGYNRKHGAKFKLLYPEKRAAHLAIARALNAGTVIKQPCVVCGEVKSESHHEDYSKQLDVIWFCRKHHAEHHAKKRKL